jgi:hypothetical protein
LAAVARDTVGQRFALGRAREPWGRVVVGASTMTNQASVGVLMALMGASLTQSQQTGERAQQM